MAASPYGWALRTSGSCEANEVVCGTGGAGYKVCCPGGSFCPDQYNRNCCPEENVNCTMSLVQAPKCANETWDLFDNDGYFCCGHGLHGYATAHQSDGCAKPGYNLQGGEVFVPLLQAGKVSTSTTSTSTSTSTSTTSQSKSSTDASSTVSSPTASSPASGASQPSPSKSSTNVGAIAGGVVGGLAAVAIIGLLAWWLLRRKSATPHNAESEKKSDPTAAGPQHITELPANFANELPA